jgi:hypothetical protein
MRGGFNSADRTAAARLVQFAHAGSEGQPDDANRLEVARSAAG